MQRGVAITSLAHKKNKKCLSSRNSDCSSLHRKTSAVKPFSFHLHVLFGPSKNAFFRCTLKKKKLINLDLHYNTFASKSILPHVHCTIGHWWDNSQNEKNSRFIPSNNRTWCFRDKPILCLDDEKKTMLQFQFGSPEAPIQPARTVRRSGNGSWWHWISYGSKTANPSIIMNGNADETFYLKISTTLHGCYATRKCCYFNIVLDMVVSDHHWE